jgi:hypothetical protein
VCTEVLQKLNVFLWFRPPPPPPPLPPSFMVKFGDEFIEKQGD